MRPPEPIRMERVAIVAPLTTVHRVLAAVGDAGVVEPDVLGEATDHLVLERVVDSSVTHGRVAAIGGWTPTARIGALAERLRPLGGAVVPLPLPLGADPPTLLAGKGASTAFQPLVDTYATVPYADVNPSLFAGLAYVVMFGMMFGDVGHGVLLLAAGIALFITRAGRLAPYRRVAPFVVGAGIASIGFGFAYGEAFGPTGIVPTLWISPLQEPTTLLAAGIAVGAVLLAVSYVIGTANRWREGGPAAALLALSGIAGGALYLGLGLVGLGWFRGTTIIAIVGGILAGLGILFGFIGLYFEAGGRATGAVQAGVELFDAVIRLGANVISFARLAAFGLTHAALCGIVWTETVAIAARGHAWWPLAAVVFLGGNAIAFALEALVAAVQALRLDYYELFSRIFIAQGRPFKPWYLPAVVGKET